MNIGPQGGGFLAPGNKDDGEASARVRAWCRETFGVAEGTTVMVVELRCPEPDCPRLETSIALLDEDLETRQRKIHKPLARITREDIAALAAEEEAYSQHGGAGEYEPQRRGRLQREQRSSPAETE